MEGEGLARLREEIEEVEGALRAQAAEFHELAKRIERLTQDTPPPGTRPTRAKVEAKAGPGKDNANR